MSQHSWPRAPGVSEATAVIRIELPAWIDALLARGERYETDEQKIGLAIELARRNVVDRTGGPFGAAVFAVDDDRPRGVGVSIVEPLHNSVLHAETVAYMQAEAALQDHDLSGHELFASGEPCAMCLGATHWAGVDRLVFAALREDAQAVGYDEGPVFPETYAYLEARGLRVVRGLRRSEARDVLRLNAGRR
jgi:tRNA(Arg) A34 adenosine deaminase TadA